MGGGRGGLESERNAPFVATFRARVKIAAKP